jgi:hypothetical protein
LADVFINPLSACRQHYEAAQVETAIAEMVDCFKYLRPALEWMRARLVYDDSIEARSLTRDGANIISEVSSLTNGDVRRQWFIYTKNRALPAQSNHRTVTISGDGQHEEPTNLTGEIRPDLVYQDAKWLSFGGTRLNEQPRLNIWREDCRILISVMNASDLNGFQSWWPRYEASEKHGKIGYFRAGGEWVSPMPLDDSTAQEVLMTSLSIGNDRYAFYRGEYYRFTKTHPDREVFHGFSVTRGDVPADLLNEHRLI